MPRYILSNHDNVLADDYTFAAFDELGGECIAATYESALGKPMQLVMIGQFRQLEPGEKRRSPAGSYYQRTF